MADQNQAQVNFTIDPNKTPILAVDAYLISSNPNSVTFNFAQATINDAQQNIVSRVALTPAQAKEFLATLNDHIEKFEV
jgi:hypothetical protein